MNPHRRMVCLGLSILAVTGRASGAERGTAADAIAMVKKAGEFLKANGKQKAFAAFNDGTNGFKDRDLYIMVYDMNGVNQAHGANARLIGKDLIGLKDADGTEIVKEFIKTAKTGKGWVDYRWPNPLTKDIELKTTYVERFGDVLIGCGIYK